ncbi:hypothetical protein [Kaistella rhinocerotis]|nr:hypothetical protein [Kaistella sp. Ran72]
MKVLPTFKEIKDPSFVGMTTAAGSAHFVIGYGEPTVSKRNFVIQNTD